jgi:hypothetical protein
MIQAKVMDYRGYYNDIKKWSPNSQFKTLIDKAKKEKAIALYLLYNGFTSKSKFGNDLFGTSIIEANEIQKIRRKQKLNGYNHGENSLYFDMLYSKMQPYQNLFCKGIQNVKLPQRKTEIEIYTGFPYSQVLESKNIDKIIDNVHINNNSQEFSIIEELNLAPIRIIVKYDTKEKMSYNSYS